MLYIIYVDIESLIQKIDYYKNNPEKSWTTKIGEHIPGGHSMSTIWAFNQIEKKSIVGIAERTAWKSFVNL